MNGISKRQRWFFRVAAWCAVPAVVFCGPTGCKSGTPWTGKPSWWGAGTGSASSAKLAAGDAVPKPSSTAKPYPTTSTPEGYVLSEPRLRGDAAAAATGAAAASPAAAAPVAITYGATPPPAASGSVTTASASTSAGPAPGSALSSIAPQVGPYGTTSGAPAALDSVPPATTPSLPPPLATSPGAEGSAATISSRFASQPPTEAGVPTEQRFGATERVADARPTPGWSAPAAAPAGAPAATPPAMSDSRYGNATGSRFSAGAFPAATAPAFEPPPAQPATAFPPPVAPNAGEAQQPPAVPRPATLPPGAAPPVPTRRPDPGYRPGGTSSYRTSRTILAGGTDGPDAGVQPAGFESDIPAAP